MTETMTATRPAHDRFERPSRLWYLLIHSGITGLAICSSSPGAYDAASSKLPLPPRWLMQAVLAGTVVVHVGEATFAYRTAKAAGMERTAGRWARETLFVGFPSILVLRKVAAEAR